MIVVYICSYIVMVLSVMLFCLQFGPYLWKTYKEVYEEVLHIGSALRASGAEPVSISFYIYTIVNLCLLYMGRLFLSFC